MASRQVIASQNGDRSKRSSDPEPFADRFAHWPVGGRRMMTASVRAMMCKLVWVSVSLFLLVPGPAKSQTHATPFAELQPHVKRDDTNDITEANWRKTHGKIGQISSSSLEVLVRKTGPDGRDTFVPVLLSERDVRQIRLDH